jgi:hypothetical protein
LKTKDCPDLVELRAYNKAACKHDRKVQRTQWVGGSPGRYGGSQQRLCWWCPDCKEVVAEAWFDTHDDLVARLNDAKGG